MDKINFYNLCRICLLDSYSYSNIFEEHLMNGCFVREILDDVYDLEISPGDGLPEFVCIQCLATIKSFILFVRKVHKGRLALTHLKQEMEKNNSGPILLKSEVLPFQTDISTQASTGPVGTEEKKSHEKDTIEASNDSVGTDGNGFKEGPMEATIKSEELIIHSSSDEASEHSFEVTETEVICGPILLKYEVLPFSRDRHSQEKFIDSEASRNLGTVESTVLLMQDYSQVKLAEPGPSGNLGTAHSTATVMEDSSKVQLTLAETVTHPQHLQCLENKSPHCAYKGAVDADSCTWNLTTNDKSSFEKSKSISLSAEVETSSSEIMEGLERQLISTGKRMHTASPFQGDIDIGKEGEKEKKETGGEVEDRRGTAPEKGVKGEKERLECYHCGNMLKTKSNLIRHMVLHGFGNSYGCEVCGRVFQTNDKLIRHGLIHSGSKPYKCAECSKCFRENHNLKIHVKSHTGSKPYKCVECGKSFSQNSSLKTHMRLHTGSKPYKCMECSKSFSQNTSLEAHTRSHTGFKPYKCTECSKSYSMNSSLSRHMRSHTGYKPFVCDKCSKGFTQSGHLKRHLLVHTKEKPYACHNCRTRFSQREDLRRHFEKYSKRKRKCRMNGFTQLNHKSFTG